ncbi:hypothetical protein CJP72_14880 [Citrobacter sp. NCU1]|nr:hypothetical protein [Citrobacter sp. NCU1]
MYRERREPGLQGKRRRASLARSQVKWLQRSSGHKVNVNLRQSERFSLIPLLTRIRRYRVPFFQR